MIQTRTLEIAHFWDRLVGWALYVLVFACLAGLAWALAVHNMAVDLRDIFLPAARYALSGGNPYEIAGFFGPPWALLPAVLVAWLPGPMACMVHGLLSMAALIGFLAAQKAEAGAAVPALLSVPVLSGVLYGNLEPFVILALVVPRPVGMLLLAMKPHVGGVLALYWVLDEFRARGLGGVARLLWPVTAALLASIIAYGPWPMRLAGLAQECGGWSWNVWGAHPWAHVFFVGIPAVFVALWREREDMALSAGPLLSPYAHIYSFGAWLPFMATWPPWAAWAVCLAVWAAVCVGVF